MTNEERFMRALDRLYERRLGEAVDLACKIGMCDLPLVREVLGDASTSFDQRIRPSLRRWDFSDSDITEFVKMFAETCWYQSICVMRGTMPHDA
jgi:hypothetical protein